jgi:hypothetical protein
MFAGGRGEDSHEFMDIIGAIEGMEKELLSEKGWRKKLDSGESIIHALTHGATGDYWVNLIPSGTPGRCRDTLVVGIGYEDSVNERILEAIEHVKVHCPGTTTKVVFLAAWWGVPEWLRHRESFDGVRVVLKILGARPILLS